MAIIKTKFSRGVEGTTNIVDGGTEGTRVATGTTGQRGSTAGQWRFNSTTGKFEGYDGSQFKDLDVAPTATAVGLSNILESQIEAGYDLAVTGTNFQSGATVKFIGNDGTEYPSATVTVNSATSISARVPTTVTNANEPFDVKVINSNGLSATKTDAFNVNGSPAWQTASGSVGTVTEGASANIQLSATDPEGDAVTYSETTSNLSGAGFSMSTAGLITGTASAVSSDTTTSFTARATSSTNNTSDRNFTIITADEGILGSAEFYIDPSDSRSWSGSGSTLTNVTSHSGKSGNTTNLSLNNATVTTNSGITYIQHNASGTAPSATIGNISGNLNNYTIAFFYKVSNYNSVTNTGMFMYGNKSQNEAIGGNLDTSTNNGEINHYNYSNDGIWSYNNSNFQSWNFYVFRKVSGSKQVYVNNSALSNVSVTNNSTNLPANSTFDYGGRNAPNAYDYWNTQLGFCGIWASNISDTDMTFLWNKFKGDYGL
tara:strand:+ start:24 stop:1481 length:1458 start_codon:yes stop_codon:yes gene_type:complete